MTSEQNAFLRMTKPSKYRSFIRFKKSLDLWVDRFVQRVCNLILKVGEKLGVFKHEVEDDSYVVDARCISKEKEIRGEQLAFNMQVNRITTHYEYIDYWRTRGIFGDRIVLDNTRRETLVEYVGFPTRPFYVVVDGKPLQVQDDGERLKFIGVNTGGEIVEPYYLDMSELKKMEIRRKFNGWTKMNYDERCETDRYTVKDFEEQFIQHMKHGFKLTKYLRDLEGRKLTIHDM